MRSGGLKITFVEPKAPGLHIWSKFRLPRLGSLLLGTTLERSGHDVRVLFEEARRIDWKRLRESDLVCISTITSTAPRAYAIADRLRSIGVPVIMGGVHPTYLPDEAIRHADWVLRGEADETIVPLVDAISQDGGFRNVKGLTWRDPNGNVVHNEAAPPVADLDKLAAPNLDLLDAPIHTRTSWAGPTIIPVQTSRGCPYDCSFCSVTGMFGRRYRFRSTESVLAEIEQYDLAGKHVFFYDDNFTANPNRTRRLLEAMMERRIRVPWSTQVHTDCARHDGLLDVMKRAGCNTLYIGLESINPRTLAAYKKAQTVEGMERAIAAIHKRGISVHGMFVFGGDDDDTETIRRTADWAKAQGIATVQFLILTPLPGTRTFRELESEGRLLLRDWSLYDTHHVVFRPKRMTPHELQLETFRAQGSFYSWGQIADSLVNGDAINAAVRLYAHNLNRQWLRSHREFLRVTEYLGATQ